MPNPFVYVQLQTSDIERATAFYRDLLGWRIDTASDYREIDVGEGTAGGIMRTPAPILPSFWLPYVAVEDVDASTARARQLGALVAVEPTDVPGKGRYSVLQDPTGASFALWTRSP